MSDWWEHGYPRSQPVAVKGFPRPLYPPDAAPEHQPSVDGSDVEAYKRTISRAGRWQWQTFDQAFSNAFSHGKEGGNVGDSGLAGVQRQQAIEPTGWLGRASFDELRSIRIPHGLPHAGEHAMDARAVELINAAWDRFGGKEPAPAPPSGGWGARARVTYARTQLGVEEEPARSNRQKYGAWYGMNGVPWCAIFCTWVDQTGPAPTSSFARSDRYAYVPYIVSDARLGRNGLTVTSDPRPGDLVCYDWAWDGEHDHVGIVETPPASNGEFVAIEGNTSRDNNGDQSNGGGVCRRSRNRYAQATVFVRVAE